MKIVLLFIIGISACISSFAIEDSTSFIKNRLGISYGIVGNAYQSNNNYSEEIAYLYDVIGYFEEVSYLRRISSKTDVIFNIGGSLQHSRAQIYTSRNDTEIKGRNSFGKNESRSFIDRTSGVNNYFNPFVILSTDILVTKKSYIGLGIKSSLPQLVFSRAKNGEKRNSPVVKGEYIPNLKSTLAWYKIVDDSAIGLELTINMLGNYLKNEPFRAGVSLRF